MFTHKSILDPLQITYAGKIKSFEQNNDSVRLQIVILRLNKEETTFCRNSRQQLQSDYIDFCLPNLDNSSFLFVPFKHCEDESL